jgi:hypothetical protein
VGARARFESEGWRFVPHDAPILVTDPDTGELTPDTHYLVEIDGTRGKVHLDAWTHPYVIGSGKQAIVDMTSLFDRQGFDATRLLWLDLGLLNPIDASVMAMKQKVQRKRVSRRVKVAHNGNPHALAVAHYEQRKLDAMSAGQAAAEADLRRAGKPHAAASKAPRRKVKTEPEPAEVGA